MKKIFHFFALFRKHAIYEVANFSEFFFYYIKVKIIAFSVFFEKYKNRLVKIFLMKRGRYNRPFLHLTTIGILSLGVIIAPFLSDTFPVFAPQAVALDLDISTPENQSVLMGGEIFDTQVSKKPRDKVIEYTVEKGDTISTVADKFGISENTIRWENGLTGDNIRVGSTLKILPVSGIAHKVVPGDTVYSIAEKYGSSAQKVVDFPFNEFANLETFAVVAGQMLIVPDGIKPSEKPFIKQQTFIAKGPVPVAGGGFTYPIRGPISQYYSGYHPGIDITAPMNTPVYAAHNGTVVAVSVGGWNSGYGTNVRISNGAGIESHYAHLNSVNVSVGQAVVGGSSVIGYNGSTGRSTGPHVHFEIRSGGVLINPLGYVQ